MLEPDATSSERRLRMLPNVKNSPESIKLLVLSYGTTEGPMASNIVGFTPSS